MTTPKTKKVARQEKNAASDIIEPYGSKNIVHLLPDTEDEKNKRKAEANQYPSIVLGARQMCDWELLVTGAFTPLDGFMGQEDYESVLQNETLANGLFWPIPITLDAKKEFVEKISVGDKISLRDPEGYMRAILEISDIWKPNKEEEANRIYGEISGHHPGVSFILNETEEYYLGGKLTGVEPPPHFDYKELRKTPAQIREIIRNKNKKVILFENAGLPHAGMVEAIVEIAKEKDSVILLQPIVGVTHPGDIEYGHRIKIIRALRDDLEARGVETIFSVLPLARRFAGVKGWEWRTIVTRNLGISSVIAMRDDIDSYTMSRDGKKRQFYAIGDVAQYNADRGKKTDVHMTVLKKLVYLPNGNKGEGRYIPLAECNEEEVLQSKPLSSTDLQFTLRRGEELPDYLVPPNLKRVLPTVFLPRHTKGIALFFCGLSGAGKSTVAGIVKKKLEEIDSRPVTLLDGDIIRTFLSSELTFSKDHRDLNVKRIGFVAGLIVKSGGVAICAPIAPYEETRQKNREFISMYGDYIEIYVATSLKVCEARETKGLYEKARKGEIPLFTGITDKFEVPYNAEVILNTSNITPEEGANEIIQYLKQERFIGQNCIK